MSEPTTEEKSADENAKPVIVKRFVITALSIIVLLLIFSQIFPRLLFAPSDTIVSGYSKNTPEKYITESTNENLIIEAPNQENTIIEEPIANEEAKETTIENTVPNEITLDAIHNEHVKAIDELKNKLSEENSKIKAEAKIAVSSLVLLSQLKEYIKSGKPYKIQVTELKNIVESKQQAVDILTSIELNAENGLVTPEQLKKNFTQLLKTYSTNKDNGFWRNLLHKFITIRKVGEQKGTDDESILARAEVNVNANDFWSAIKELQTLTPATKEIFNDWIKDSERWLDVSTKIDLLQLLLTKTEPASQI